MQQKFRTAGLEHHRLFTDKGVLVFRRNLLIFSRHDLRSLFETECRKREKEQEILSVCLSASVRVDRWPPEKNTKEKTLFFPSFPGARDR